MAGSTCCMSNRRNKRAYRTCRRIDLAPAIARGELRVLQILANRIDACVRDVRGLETAEDFGGRQVREHGLDRRGQRVAMLDPRRRSSGTEGPRASAGCCEHAARRTRPTRGCCARPR